MQTTLINLIEWPENPQPAKFNLYPYQQDAVSRVIGNYTSGKSKRQMIVLATALGKTPTMAAIAKWVFQNTKKPILLLAHRQELLDQAIDEFADFTGSDYNCEIEKAESHVSMTSHAVMASVATLGRDGSERITKFPRDYFGAVLIDEAHHSFSDSYRRIIEYFSPEQFNTLLVGVTATPDRTDKESLAQVFDTVAYKMDIVDGTKQKYLTPVISYRVGSQTDLSQVRTTAGDFNLKDLSLAVNNKERNTLIVDIYKTRFPDKRAIVFATDLNHVHELTHEFNSIGVRSAAITGESKSDDRRRDIEDFKSGKIKVIVNYGVLTEGYNDKPLDLAIMARPTQSKLLLTQILGRLTRKCEGKDVSHFVEIIDMQSNKTATAAQVFHFRQDFDCEGHDFLECMNKAASLVAEKDYFNPYNCDSWSNMLLRFEAANPRNPSGLIGAPTERGPRQDKEAIYSEFNPSLEYYDGRYRYFYFGDTLKLLHTDQQEGFRYQVLATTNPIGGYDIGMYRKTIDARKSDPATTVIKFRGTTAPDAVRKMEDWILENHPEWDILLNINARWRKKAQTEACTDKQYNLIIKMKISTKPQNQISKAEAMNMLSEHFAKY